MTNDSNEERDDRKTNIAAPDATGKWFAANGGGVTTFDIKVNDKGKVTGSVSLCGGQAFWIKSGSMAGGKLSFETEKRVGSVLVQQTWTGDLIDNDTLTLSSSHSSHTQCGLPSGLNIVFTRPAKQKKYSRSPMGV